MEKLLNLIKFMSYDMKKSIKVANKSMQTKGFP